jgi:hypothetical protein
MRCRQWFFLLAALPFTVSGCASLSTAERAARMQQEVDEMIQVYGPACEKLGYPANTDLWRECILKLNTSRQIERLERLERLDAPMMITDCWRHRGFCSSF